MSTGIVRGRWENGVAAYRGVPFAAPPVGPRRFAAPQPAEPWQGVRDAGRFGPPPPQPGRATESDDWLNLAVWTPDPGRANLPVVVWISGGGYLSCDSADPYLTGAAAGRSRRGAGQRALSQRIRRLRAHQRRPDNRALLDQVAALRWVQDNIARFGGDPSNVTVLGQSAGAGSIAALLLMPAAAGTFRRAILQSIPGTYFTPNFAGESRPRSAPRSAECRCGRPRRRRAGRARRGAATIVRPIVFCSASTAGARWRTPQRRLLLCRRRPLASTPWPALAGRRRPGRRAPDRA